MRVLLKELNIEGSIVVADALNCQKETAETVINCKADYLLSVKGNQSGLMEMIENFVQDDKLQSTMEKATKTEKNHGRYEKRQLTLHQILTGYIKKMNGKIFGV